MWDERFSLPGYAYGTEPNSFLVQMASEIPSGRVLSLAEGEGRNAVYLAGRGYTVLVTVRKPSDRCGLLVRRPEEVAPARG